VEPTPFSHLAVKGWPLWEVRVGGSSAVQSGESHPYLCIPGGRFYEFVLQRISGSRNVTLRFGESVRGVWEGEGEVRVGTEVGEYAASLVFDGRGLAPGSAGFERARKEAVWLPQQFLGQQLRALRPVFEPGRCTLMDFDVDQGRGLRFVYVLPFGEREAMVENVYLAEVEVAPEDHRREICEYLEARYGLSEYEVLGEERGYIPMTTYPFSKRSGERVHNIGTLGGQTRPSTGYTFLRIQRRCRVLARSAVRGDPLPEWDEPRRTRLLDDLFLRFLLERPGEAPEVYRRMFEGVPSGALVRFLTERSPPAAEARLVGALPKRPFVRVGARRLLGRRA
jgi:lycopene beta-cyclase